MKKLFISIFTAVFALFALGTSTFAWFSMNTQAEASGMEVKAIAGSSLQISNTTTFKSGKTSYAFTEGAYTVKPATQYDSEHPQAGIDSEDLPESLLVTVKNTGDINPETGLAKQGKDLIYENADTQSTVGDDAVNGYYVDYVLYFAAEGTETSLSAGKLKLTIAKATAADFVPDEETGEVESDPVLKAVTIMVLFKQANASEYTVCADLIRLLNGATDYEICDLADDGVIIPASVNGNTAHPNALEVVLRVYVDGAYLEPAGTSTYVRNTAIVDLDQSLGFSATFDYVE